MKGNLHKGMSVFCHRVMCTRLHQAEVNCAYIDACRVRNDHGETKIAPEGERRLSDLQQEGVVSQAQELLPPHRRRTR